MKTTKIAFWRKVKENCEKNEIVPCTGIYDSDCPYGTRSKECKMCEGGNGKEALAYAEAYIKRHEQKSKKRIIPKYTADVQPDTTGSELKKIVMKATVKQNLKLAPIQCCKCVRVETCKRKEKELSILPSCDGYVSNESMMYVHTVDPNEKKVESVMTTTSDPTPLDIAKAIRDNEYRCNSYQDVIYCYNGRCPLFGKACGTISLILRKQLIDSYISSHEKPESRPNFRKYLRDKVDMKVRVTPELSEELQKIACEEGIKTRSGNLLPKNTGCRMIRFYCCDHYSLVYYPGIVTFEKIEATEYNPETDTLVEKVEEPKPIKTVGIDNSDTEKQLTEEDAERILRMIKIAVIKPEMIRGCE